MNNTMRQVLSAIAAAVFATEAVLAAAMFAASPALFRTPYGKE